MEAEHLFDAKLRSIYLHELKEYESTRRLKTNERKLLREWVDEYNSVYSNPFYVRDDNGNLVDFLTAYRQCVKEYKVKIRKELKEYERSIVDLTDEERRSLYEWVSDGNSVYDNPCHMAYEGGYPVDYIEAIRTIEEMREEYCEPLREENHESLQLSDDELPF